jgi:hypothetical protein
LHVSFFHIKNVLIIIFLSNLYWKYFFYSQWVMLWNRMKISRHRCCNCRSQWINLN